MKFLSIALTALLGMAEAKKSISKTQLQSRMAKGQFNKSTLMRGSKPYNANAKRALEENQEEQEWEINGYYSVGFNSCISMTVQDEDIFDENLIYYAKQGELTAEKSYIIFDVCLTNECYYDADDSKMQFITSIGTFFQAFSDYLPNQREEYCNGCKENEDYCDGTLAAEYEEQQAQEAEEEANQDGDNAEDGEDANEGDEGEDANQGEEGEGEGRKLAQNQNIQYIDCDICYEYECFEEEEQEGQEGDDAAQQQYDMEDALQWLEGLSQCQQIEDAVWNNQAVYSGLICNEEGNGVEIGVFLDEDCSVFANGEAYSNVWTYSDQQYFSMTKDLVEYMFVNDFNCYQEEIQYINPYTEMNDDEAQEEEEDDGNAPEAAEWCNELFGGEMEAVSMYDCGYDANADANDDQNNEYDENLDNYEWYSYQLTQEQAEDATEVCEVFKGNDGEQAKTIYKKDNSGTLYNYNKAGANGEGTNGGTVALIVILVLIVAAVGASMAFKKKSTDTKKAPLINANGAMA